jgi:DNA repair exonuclease SbcCD ATPase subunit
MDCQSSIALTPILAFLLALRIVTYLVVRNMKEQYVARIVRMRLILETLAGDLDDIGKGALEYPVGAPEPYGSVARKLDEDLSKARKICDLRMRDRRKLLRETPNLPCNVFVRFLWGFGPEPYRWMMHHSKTLALWKSIQRLETLGISARHLLDDLHHMPITVSHRCKDVGAIRDGILSALDFLKSKGFHGEKIALFTEQVVQFTSALQIPGYYFQDSDDLILQQASKDSTISAWQILEKVEKPLRENQKLAQQWQSQFREVDQIYQTAQQSFDLAQQRLREIPESIDLRELDIEQSELSDRYARLQEQLKHPTIETLGSIREQAEGIVRDLDQLARRAAEIRQQHNELREILITNNALMEQLSNRLKELETADKFPLRWQQTETEFRRLSREQTHIGMERTKRTLVQLSEHLKAAKQFHSDVLTLAKAVERVGSMRAEMIGLLESLMISEGTTLTELAENLQKSVNKYALENWDQQDSVSTLLTDAQMLARQQSSLVPERLDETLEESSLGSRFDALQVFAKKRKDFQERLERIAETLDSIKKNEDQAYKDINHTLQALERLVPIPQVSPLRTSFDSYWKAIDVLKQQGRGYGEQLDNRLVGTVSEKTKLVATWKESAETQLRALHQAIRREVKRTKDGLEETVKALKKIASFAQEQVMTDAANLLNVTYAYGVDDAQTTPLDRTASQINDLVREHTDLRSCVERIEATIEKPLRSYLAKLDSVRKTAEKKVKDLNMQLQQNDWPPISCDLEPITNRMHRAEQNLAELGKLGENLPFVVARINHVIELYEEIADLADDKVSILKEQRAELNAIQSRINKWKRQLGQYRELNITDRGIVSAVDERLNRIGEEYSAARLRHANQPLTFNEAKNVLDELWKIAYQDLHVDRPRTVQTIRINTIVSAASVSISQSAEG